MRGGTLDGVTATVYVPGDSDFRLPAAAKRAPRPPPTPPLPVVEEVGKDEVRVYFGTWCLTIAWEKGHRGRRLRVETDPVADPPPKADDPDEDAQRLDSWTDHVDDYVGCVEVLIDQFRDVAA